MISIKAHCSLIAIIDKYVKSLLVHCHRRCFSPFGRKITMFSQSLQILDQLFINFNIDFRLKMAHVDEIGNCEIHVFKKIVESDSEM